MNASLRFCRIAKLHSQQVFRWSKLSTTIDRGPGSWKIIIGRESRAHKCTHIQGRKKKSMQYHTKQPLSSNLLLLIFNWRHGSSCFSPKSHHCRFKFSQPCLCSLKLHATLCRYFRIPGFRPPPQYFSCLPRTYHHESTTIPTTVTPKRH